MSPRSKKMVFTLSLFLFSGVFFFGLAVAARVLSIERRLFDVESAAIIHAASPSN